MVSVVVLRPFEHLGRAVASGEWIDLDPLDAAVKAQAGLVSLSHGTGYQTREMVAAAPVQAMTFGSCVEPPSDEPVPQTPPKRRRGRPRKAL